MTKKSYKIDEITWNDLDMEEILSRIDHSSSSVGSEYLRDALHSPQFSADLLKMRSKKITFFQNEKKAKDKLTGLFKKLGKTKKVSFLDYIFRLKEVPAGNNLWHVVLIVLLLIAFALVFVIPAVGIIAFVVMIAINIITYFKTKAGIEGYFICLKYLVSMVVCAEKILSADVLDKEIFKPEIEALSDSVKTFSGLKRGSWLITNSVSGSLVDVIMDYVRMIFHVDLMKFNSMKAQALSNEEQIRILYNTLGELELCMSAAEFREELPYWCEPVFYNSREEHQKASLSLIAQDLYHPLLQNAVPNSIKTERSVLLTGSNASGKSTFLKALALNQLFAQTFYTCPAKQFITTFFKLMSSMALKDSILDNESYFIVEIKSLKRIFDELGDVPVMCFIDEVLRGTNTIERIAASSRLLSGLAKESTLVFAATHDIELTSLLKDVMDNYHFSETVTDGNVEFDYKLKPGAADTSNAIRLMEAFGFDKAIVSGAQERADAFRKSGQWN